MLTSRVKGTRVRGDVESGIPLARKPTGLDARGMESPNESSEAGDGEGEPRLPLGEQAPAGGQLAPDTLRLWTAWQDYSATGEGRAFMACIAFVKTEEEIISHFGKKFHPWFEKGCDAGQGVVRNRVTTLLWSATLLDHIERAADAGAVVEAHSWMHFNMLSL